MSLHFRSFRSEPLSLAQRTARYGEIFTEMLKDISIDGCPFKISELSFSFMRLLTPGLGGRNKAPNNSSVLLCVLCVGICDMYLSFLNLVGSRAALGS
jgi:hypothetical protein